MGVIAANPLHYHSHPSLPSSRRKGFVKSSLLMNIPCQFRMSCHRTARPCVGADAAYPLYLRTRTTVHQDRLACCEAALKLLELVILRCIMVGIALHHGRGNFHCCICIAVYVMLTERADVRLPHTAGIVLSVVSPSPAGYVRVAYLHQFAARKSICAEGRDDSTADCRLMRCVLALLLGFQ